MKKELFDSMSRQMSPSPELRAVLSEKLARPGKKRPPVRRYVALAACAALVVGVFTVYQAGKPRFHPLKRTIRLHSYVTVEGLTSYVTEDAAINDTGTGGAEVNTGDLPGGAYIGDVPAQEEANRAYNKLAPYIRSHPDWYGGAYIDDTGTLIVCLVKSRDPGDKSLELKVLDWTDNGRVGFTSGKYSLGYLLDLQTKVCDALYDIGLDYGCGTDEEHNRLDLTLTSVTDEALALLARLDPDDDAIYVQVGQQVSFDNAPGEDVGTASARTEDPAVHHVMPGGVTVPEGEDPKDPIAEEPVYDRADYDLEQLPDKLPGEERPADTVQSLPQEDGSTSAPSFDPNSGFSSPFSGSQS